MTATIIVTIKVEDFTKWKTAFDAATPMREKMGINITGIYRQVDDENILSVISEYPSIEVAKAILASPEWAQAQQKAGVIGGFNTQFFTKVA